MADVNDLNDGQRVNANGEVVEQNAEGAWEPVEETPAGAADTSDEKVRNETDQ